MDANNGCNRRRQGMSGRKERKGGKEENPMIPPISLFSALFAAILIFVLSGESRKHL
jgi:hypothetical protein